MAFSPAASAGAMMLPTVRTSKMSPGSALMRLAQGQNPVALLLACSDSRVVPGLLLSADPGDIFEVRTVGNIIAPADAAGENAMGDESEAAASSTR